MLRCYLLDKLSRESPKEARFADSTMYLISRIGIVYLISLRVSTAFFRFSLTSERALSILAKDILPSTLRFLTIFHTPYRVRLKVNSDLLS